MPRNGALANKEHRESLRDRLRRLASKLDHSAWGDASQRASEDEFVTRGSRASIQRAMLEAEKRK